MYVSENLSLILTFKFIGVSYPLRVYYDVQN